MADDSKTLPARPPRGMIKIDDAWQVRRFGLLVQRRLTCIFGHHVHVTGRPFEIAVPCNHLELRGTHASAHCSAYLYVFVTRPKLVWAMDLTEAESEIINQYSLDVDAIVSHFGVGFPDSMKIVKPSSSIARATAAP